MNKLKVILSFMYYFISYFSEDGGDRTIRCNMRKLKKRLTGSTEPRQKENKRGRGAGQELGSTLILQAIPRLLCIDSN